MKKYFLMVTMLMVFVFTHVLASSALEKSDLARINAILSHINPIINEAERQQASNERVKFCYQCLREDISKIQVGIHQGIHGMSIEPRKVSPLKGDYLSSTAQEKP